MLAAVLIAYYVMSTWYPYAENIYNSNTDWSKINNAGLEPWDGTLLGMYLLTFVAWAAIGFASLLGWHQDPDVFWRKSWHTFIRNWNCTYPHCGGNLLCVKGERKLN